MTMTECLKATNPLIQELEKRSDMEPMKVRIFLLLADAAVGQGGMRLAHEYGDKAKSISSRFERNLYNPELEACNHREAIKLMAAGRPQEAVEVLISVHHPYVDTLMESGINMSQVHVLTPLMAGLKVLAAAMVQTGAVEYVLFARSILKDVKETESNLAGYWEGVVEETRRELEEDAGQRLLHRWRRRLKRRHDRLRRVRLRSGRSRSAKPSNRRRQPRWRRL
jgi:hypothetical protein